MNVLMAIDEIRLPPEMTDKKLPLGSKPLVESHAATTARRHQQPRQRDPVWRAQTAGGMLRKSLCEVQVETDRHSWPRTCQLSQHTSQFHPGAALDQAARPVEFAAIQQVEDDLARFARVSKIIGTDQNPPFRLAAAVI